MYFHLRKIELSKIIQVIGRKKIENNFSILSRKKEKIIFFHKKR